MSHLRRPMTGSTGRNHNPSRYQSHRTSSPYHSMLSALQVRTLLTLVVRVAWGVCDAYSPLTDAHRRGTTPVAETNHRRLVVRDRPWVECLRLKSAKPGGAAVDCRSGEKRVPHARQTVLGHGEGRGQNLCCSSYNLHCGSGVRASGQQCRKSHPVASRNASAWRGHNDQDDRSKGL